MVTEVAKRLINVEEYYKMAEVGILKPSDHVELIHGEIIDMSPIGSKHAGVEKSINRVLNRLLSDQVLIGIQDPIRIDNGNEPEPDVSILKPRPDNYVSSHPVSSDVLGIIEVSESSYDYDSQVKSSLYASAGIVLYWVVDVENERIEVYTKPKSDEYSKKEIFTLNDELVLLGNQISAKDIFGKK